jgi:hypothetical protein
VIRKAGALDALRSRARQGMPERVEDPLTVTRLAALLRDRSCVNGSRRDEHAGRNPAA